MDHNYWDQFLDVTLESDLQYCHRLKNQSLFEINAAICGHPICGFRFLISMTSFISSFDGPSGPGFLLVLFLNRMLYFLFTKAL